MSFRSRSSNGLAQASLIENSRNVNCSTPNWFLSYTHPTIKSVSGTWNWSKDFVVPRYHARSRKGEVFFNPYDKVTDVFEASGNGYLLSSVGPSCTSPIKYAEYKADGAWLAAFIPHESHASGINTPLCDYAYMQTDLDQLYAEVSTAVASKRGRASTDTWESIAEVRQTLELLRNPVQRSAAWLTRLRVHVEKSRKKRGRKGPYTLLDYEHFITDSPGIWLKYRYGIRPIMLQIEEILKNQFDELSRRRVTTRASTSASAQKTTSGISNFGIIRVEWSNTIFDRMAVRGMSLDEFTYSLMDKYGFSAKSLITLPWELVTLSFVADWFGNIGDYLGALVPAFGWHQLGGCTTVRHYTVNTYRVVSCTCTNGSYRLDVPVLGEISVSRTAFRRQGLSVPELVIRQNFGFSNTNRVIDAFALLAARFFK